MGTFHYAPNAFGHAIRLDSDNEVSEIHGTTLSVVRNEDHAPSGRECEGLGCEWWKEGLEGFHKK